MYPDIQVFLSYPPPIVFVAIVGSVMKNAATMIHILIVNVLKRIMIMLLILRAKLSSFLEQPRAW